MRRFDVIVIGAGVAGLSTAYFLSKKSKLSVAVIEQEKKLGGHASGRNAGMLRQALPDPILAEMAIKSRGHFSRASKNGWKKLELEPNGSLLLSSGDDVQQLDAVARTLHSLGQSSQRLSRAACAKKVPLLADANFDEALFYPKDALVDIEALLDGFLYNLKKRGVPVLKGRRLTDVKRVEGGYEISCGRERFAAKKLVNAAGAWAAWTAQKAGAQRIPLMAYRRHLYLTAAQSRTGQWPFVWDLSHDLYFRPMGKKLLISPCDKTPEKKGDRKEKVDPAMKKKMLEKMKLFSAKLSEIGLPEAKSGLRTMSPDGRFIIGEDGKLKDFYWVAGLGGHGVTSCFSAGELAADQVLGRVGAWKRLAAALSPERFLPARAARIAEGALYVA